MPAASAPAGPNYLHRPHHFHSDLQPRPFGPPTALLRTLTLGELQWQSLTPSPSRGKTRCTWQNCDMERWGCPAEESGLLTRLHLLIAAGRGQKCIIIQSCNLFNPATLRDSALRFLIFDIRSGTPVFSACYSSLPLIVQLPSSYSIVQLLFSNERLHFCLVHAIYHLANVR